MFLASKRTLYYTLIALFILVFKSSIDAQILRNEHDIMKAARRAGGMQTLNKAKSSSDSDQFLLNLLGESSDVVDRARQALYEGLVANENQYNVSSLCLNHTEMLLEGIVSGEEWALRMVDAMGKPHSGLLNAHFTWLGDYDECRAVQAAVKQPGEISSPYTGRYCKAAFGNYQQQQSLSPQSIVVTIGVCVPSSCNDNDTTAFLNILLSLLPINTTALSNPTVACQLESLELETKAIVVIVICSLFGLVMVAATAYDVVIIHWWNDISPKYEALKEECEKINPDSDKKHYGTTDTNGASYQASYQANGHVAHEAVEIGKVDLDKTQKQSNQPGTLAKVLLSFSVYSNAAKILNTNQPAGTLTAVNGIRFISMTWVIMGHSYGFGISAAENMVTFMPKMLKRFTFQAIANATVSVDTFFTLSGLLVAYLSLKEMKKRGGAKKMNWAMFYFHRFWRLTPPYMLFLMFYVCLTKYWSDGPLWPQQGLEVDDCKDTWWKNLLYINNLVGTEKQCMGWSWYLANDMQFYVLSPLMLIPLYYSTLLGSLSCLALLLVNFISTGVISARDELGPSILGQNGDENMQDVYIKPWCRIGPYVVGFFAGYILYKTDCRIRIPKILNILGWVSATAIALLVLYGLYDSSGFPTLSVGVSAFYNATNRSAWGLAVAWVIVACATGNGGFINTLLSWKGIIPLSRLTYCAYLVHLVVMDTYYLSKRSLVYLTDLEEIYVFCGHLCLSYAVAFVVSLTFESPMMGLEKALLGRGKNS